VSNYNNKKKNKKKLAKEKARKAKQAGRSRFIKEEHRLEKTIELIKWQNRSKLKPFRKPKEEDDA
jgi:hypothetical protein|tara:strand:+ start:847 stop:1041 length:195 start_codon:yes stop_codon:yes gene_type:complete